MAEVKRKHLKEIKNKVNKQNGRKQNTEHKLE